MPAERIDLVIDFSAYGPGDELLLRNDNGQGGTVPIMRFDVVGGGGRRGVPRPRAPPSAPTPVPGTKTRRRWELGLGSSAWQINGLGFDPTRVDARPRLGSTEFCRPSSTAPIACTPCTSTAFSSASSNTPASRVDTADRLGWKDTVGVLPNETVTVLAWFAPYAGRYVFHCHALEHADKAMMLQLEVIE